MSWRVSCLHVAARSSLRVDCQFVESVHLVAAVMTFTSRPKPLNPSRFSPFDRRLRLFCEAIMAEQLKHVVSVLKQALNQIENSADSSRITQASSQGQQNLSDDVQHHASSVPSTSLGPGQQNFLDAIQRDFK